ncbi:hypothetical protein PV10_05385 [Exophiala mesophila]|uniref:Response regulatory domain-containing protein n=1 Tax=Exophiala mesophila TaxID=212818 RepID=A0A0D1Z7J8_EXOME|nr:uncharacterized protein PV10_05385 [Exophiala mesophila]KIV90777.1 hypothetical protein PV10_05385 [Exophiala mesophila]
MPLSSKRPGSHVPVFRSLSANATNDKAHERSDDKSGEAEGASVAPLSSLGFNFGLPTISSLANLSRHRRRNRTKSNDAQKKSYDDAPSNLDLDQTAVHAHLKQARQGHDHRALKPPEIDSPSNDNNEQAEPPRPLYHRTTTASTDTTANSFGSASAVVMSTHSTTVDTKTTTPDAAASTSIASPSAVSASPSAPPPPPPADPTGSSHNRSDAQATRKPLELPKLVPSTTATSAPVPVPSTSSATPPATSTSIPISSPTAAITIHPDLLPKALRDPACPQSPTPPSTLADIDSSPTPTTIPQPPKIPPPLLVVQQPSTPTLPTLPALSTAPTSHDSLFVMPRKVWVKRPGASSTRVEVAEDDLVDNVRDVILSKYANSLGRTIDAPDITLKIVSREPHNKNVASERPLGPDEPIARVLETYYPGGQTIDEALLIEVPARRTPRASPRVGNHQVSYFYPAEQYRPDDGAREYFPPMPVQSPHLAHVQHQNSIPHAMSILTTGQPPLLPSPGSQTARRRPKYPRQHTSSPTILHTVQPNGQVLETKPQINGTAPNVPALPTPPAQPNELNITPPGRPGSPHAGHKPKRKKMPNANRSASGEAIAPAKPAISNLLDGSVPPINVLLVEDNNINLKLLEAFMKRLKVRWKSAVNGREAVNMWKTGGFHLVLMDIQLPVMNGLEATKEIRRLEAVNGIGVFSVSPMEHGLKMANKNNGPVSEEDTLPDKSLFKSPVIIVALTASSLQSDRHEALAAGCNDFLTKPVNFVWMERKVTEWGCMQALIDFDGWRKWKEYADEKAKEDPAKRAAEEKEEKAKTKAALKAMFARPPPTTKKDSGSSMSTQNSDKTINSASNGTPRKPAGSPGAQGDERRPRSHKSSRSSVSLGERPGGNLESMAEEDEKAP